MNVSLRERNDNIVFLKQFTHPKAYRAANIPQKLLPADVAPEIRIKNERIIAAAATPRLS
jgi:hypothetical protein